MNNLLVYKDYYGTVEYSSEDNILFGKVVGISGLISYEGSSVAELENDFREAVDDYLAMCEDEGIEPQKTYKGSFNVRISPMLHRRLAVLSAARHKTLNATVEEALQEYIRSYT